MSEVALQGGLPSHCSGDCLATAVCPARPPQGGLPGHRSGDCLATAGGTHLETLTQQRMLRLWR